MQKHYSYCHFVLFVFIIGLHKIIVLVQKAELATGKQREYKSSYPLALSPFIVAVYLTRNLILLNVTEKTRDIVSNLTSLAEIYTKIRLVQIVH